MGGYTASRCPYPLPPLTPPIYPILPPGPQALPTPTCTGITFLSLLFYPVSRGLLPGVLRDTDPWGIQVG